MSFPTIWKLPPAAVTESFCQFQGDPYCQFNISYQSGRQPVKNFFSFFFTKKNQLLDALEEIEKSKIDLKKKYDFRQIEIIRDYDISVGQVVCDRTEIVYVVEYGRCPLVEAEIRGQHRDFREQLVAGYLTALFGGLGLTGTGFWFVW